MLADEAPAGSWFPASAGLENCPGAREAMAHFMPSFSLRRFIEGSRGQFFWIIRVSRYKVDREQVTSQGILSLIADAGAVAV